MEDSLLLTAGSISATCLCVAGTVKLIWNRILKAAHVIVNTEETITLLKDLREQITDADGVPLGKQVTELTMQVNGIKTALETHIESANFLAEIFGKRLVTLEGHAVFGAIPVVPIVPTQRKEPDGGEVPSEP